MTLEQLRIFVAVAEDQHVTRAAARIGVAQSAASAAIAALEAAHRVLLFDRLGRGIRLTEAGRTLLPQARAILAQTDLATLMLSGFGKLVRGTLHLQASETIASYWLPRRLVDFRAAHPNLTIRLSIGNSAEAVAAVLSGSAEIGFVEGPVRVDDLWNLDLAEDQLVIVVGPGHAWARRDRVSSAELSESAWVMREVGSGTRSAFEDDLVGIGVSSSSLEIALELPRNEAVVSAVQAGLGAAAVSANAIAAKLEDGLLHRVPIDLPRRIFKAVRHVDRFPSPAAAALLEFLAERR